MRKIDGDELMDFLKYTLHKINEYNNSPIEKMAMCGVAEAILELIDEGKFDVD